MTWRRALVAAALLSSTALACGVILGIEDDRFRVADAAAVPDPCIHAQPPGPPIDASANENAPTLPDLVFAFERARVNGRDDAGLPVGYDLDGVCTCDLRPGAAHAGARSCVPRDPDASSCDLEGGIDDVSALQFPTVFGAQLDAVFDEQVGCGRQTMLLQLSHYNGTPDDPDVVVAVTPSYGIFDPHDGGEDLDAAAACNFPGVVLSPDSGYPAKLDGTDIWSVPAASVDQGILRDRFQGYVTQGRLVVKLDANDGTGGWSIIVGGRVVPFRTTVLSAKLNRRPDGTFRLDEGILTSRVGVDDMLATAGALRIQTGEYVCAQPELYLPIKKLICASADLMRVPSADFTGVPCDALSLVLLFTAGPATIGRSAPPQAQTPVGCAIGLVDTCANAP